MNAIKETGVLWKLSLAVMVLICFNTGLAQTSYRVTDLGALHDGTFGCAMGLNNKGWAESMDGFLNSSGNFQGRAVINVDGLKVDLGTLGGPDSWINWGGINDRGDTVGLAETSVPDPNGEDFCTFGTKLTCRAFLWKNGDMTALPTLGGNNGQASAVNNRGQIVGTSETTTGSSCPAFGFALPVLWEKGKPHQLPTVEGDPLGAGVGINDSGQAVGFTGPCSVTTSHAVLWQNGVATKLPSLGGPGSNNDVAFAINNRGQVVGQSSPDGTTFYAVLWQNGTVTNLGTLPGDFASYATGINNKGQVVGTTFDSNFNPSHAFIWENGVMTDLNTLLPANSNLYATMANKINSRGQISGMATVVSGPDAGNIHSFLATPVESSIGESIAAVAPTQTKATLPESARKHLLRR